MPPPTPRPLACRAERGWPRSQWPKVTLVQDCMCAYMCMWVVCVWVGGRVGGPLGGPGTRCVHSTRLEARQPRQLGAWGPLTSRSGVRVPLEPLLSLVPFELPARPYTPTAASVSCTCRRSQPLFSTTRLNLSAYTPLHAGENHYTPLHARRVHFTRPTRQSRAKTAVFLPLMGNIHSCISASKLSACGHSHTQI